MPRKSWFSKESRHSVILQRHLFPLKKQRWTDPKQNYRSPQYLCSIPSASWSTLNKAFLVPQKPPESFSPQGTVLTCTYNTMNINYTEVFFTNTCDRPYGVAQAATRDYNTLLYPNLFTIVRCSARTFVPIPIHSKFTSHHYCSQQRWSNSSDKVNNQNPRSFGSQRTSKVWFPLGACLAVGSLLCLLRRQLQLKLLLRGEDRSHMDSLMSYEAGVWGAHSSLRLSSTELKQHWEALE